MSPTRIRLLSVLAPAAVALAVTALSVRGWHTYGLAIFVGAPLFIGVTSSWIAARHAGVSLFASIGLAMLSQTAMAAGVIAIALDGFICVLMAMPLAFGLVLVASFIGHAIGAAGRPAQTDRTGMLAVTLLPLAMLVESGVARTRPPTLHAVTTSVDIAAAPETVWRNVVTFAPISAPPQGLFRLGIAYPIGARIEGTGVGAVRYCRFSTGDFVEPITVWDAPRRLAFDVTANPPPMREVSIYPDLHAPHLEDTFTSERGQFLLEPTATGTRLTGTTWYRQRIWPDVYWHRLSDALIHRIHQRVLDHIRTQAEGGTGPTGQGDVARM